MATKINIDGYDYIELGNIKGEKGATGPRGVGWSHGSGAPSNSTALLPNQHYIDIVTKDIYVSIKKTDGSNECEWVHNDGANWNIKGSEGNRGKQTSLMFKLYNNEETGEVILCYRNNIGS